MYQAILFDLDDTLLNFAACETNALREAFSLAGFDVVDEMVWSKVWLAYKPISDRYWSQRAISNFSREQIIEVSIYDTLNSLNYHTSNSSAIANSYWDIFCQTACLNIGVIETIQSLVDRYKLGIVTNGYSLSQRSRIGVSGLESYFKSIVISDEVGYAKPAREIFEIALNNLQVEPKDTLFVGDSISHDYLGAINTGLDFCYYQQEISLKINQKLQYTISQMSELITILGKDFKG
jgi:YjjG family noncanonical pyrimidine nucleotidase